MQHFTLASIPRRLLANFVDSAVMFVVTYPLSIAVQDSPCILFLMSLIVHCCYYTYFLVSLSQASVGQKLVGIHTITYNNKKINFSTAFDRTISEFLCPAVIMVLVQVVSLTGDRILVLGMVLFLQVAVLFLYACWYLMAVFSKNKQTFHDVVFCTMVVVGRSTHNSIT